MAVAEEQHQAFQQRYRAARARAGLPPLISDERELRMIAAVMAAARRRRQSRSEPDTDAER